MRLSTLIMAALMVVALFSFASAAWSLTEMFGDCVDAICAHHETTFFAASMFALVTTVATILIWRLR